VPADRGFDVRISLATMPRLTPATWRERPTEHINCDQFQGEAYMNCIYLVNCDLLSIELPFC
jgi:hypothetical protein